MESTTTLLGRESRRLREHPSAVLLICQVLAVLLYPLLYLSFTTLASVGLSDVAPTLAHARSVVMLEQLAGVMYIALVVARPVGLTITRQTDRERR